MKKPLKNRSLRTRLLAGSSLGVLAGLGFQAAHYMPPALLKTGVQWALGLIGIAWLFVLSVYNKLSDLCDSVGLDYQQHQQLAQVVRVRLRGVRMRAINLGVSATVLSMPVILASAEIDVPSWLIAAAFAALGLVVLSLKASLNDLEDIRELKFHVRQLERREQQRHEQSSQLQAALPGQWEPDPHFDSLRPGVSAGKDQ